MTGCETVAADVGYMWRKIGQAVKPDINISVDGDKWSITSVTQFFKLETSFELGKEFEDTRPDGKKVKVSKKASSHGIDAGRFLYVCGMMTKY